MSTTNTKGIIIGKFFPLHRGHCFLIDMAHSMCDELYVFLCSKEEESISGEIRFQALQETYPYIKIHHIDEEIDDAHHSNPEAPKIWSEFLKQYILPQKIDFVFSSESYGTELATHLDARAIVVDVGREIIPISGSEIRKNPYAHWDYIAPALKPYLVKKISVVGSQNLIYVLIENLGALYCKSYVLQSHSNVVFDTAETQKIISARLDALCKQEYPLVLIDISQYDAHNEIVQYEKSLCDAHFEIEEEKDIRIVLDWWKTIISISL